MKELETLKAIERRYESALSAVRVLILIVQGDPPSFDTAESSAPPAASLKGPSRSGFSNLTKGDAAERLIKELGDMSVIDLFDQMKQRGHAVANARSLSSMLSTDDRFAPRGGGVWGLAQLELSAA